MRERLPPLTALRAFDAAARHMSFSRAAAELNVTPAALSFQIKSLEEHLGQPLFIRRNRAVDLTEAGRALMPGTEEGFRVLSGAWRAARRVVDDRTLNVTAGPAFTAKWLAPRLYEFAQAHPQIELRFSASLRLMDLDREEVDVAIRFGYGVSGNVFSRALASEWITPVMTPALAQQVNSPADLAKLPIIFDDSISFLDPPCDWSVWFRAMGEDFVPTHGPRFSQADHATDAALAGVGAVLGRRALVIKDLAEGRLVAPFKTAIATRAGFRFLCLPGAETRPQIAAFLDWIEQEIRRTSALSDQFEIIDPGDIPPAR